ncbi:hypothetical protein QE382_000394 [Sphingobacterium zeae]|uniref:Uncharacterized protein n=1 Tax=Sphingobacterium zeae TaxID=1776859 RepID=A0ABU0U0C9_9SPHI|nr:hypothetical protein [Sphingobacterium zeae]
MELQRILGLKAERIRFRNYSDMNQNLIVQNFNRYEMIFKNKRRVMNSYNWRYLHLNK